MNNRRFEYLLFDLDGTLVDSVTDLANSLNLLADELGFPRLSIDYVRTIIGDGASKLIKRAYGEESYRREFLLRFLEIYGEHLVETTRCYPGIEQLLAGYPADKLAVVTNKPYQLTIELLAGLDLLKAFKVVIGGDSFAEKKPHPLPVQKALQALGANPAQAIMIGDHHTDLRSGRDAGTAICFCSYGIGNNADIAADYTATSSTDLLRLFPSPLS